MELSILVNKFNVKGRLVALQPFGNGNINDTFLAIYRNTFTETQVILQRVNRNVFPNPELIMENMHEVTRHCHEKLEEDAKAGRDDRVWQMPRIVKTKDGADYVTDETGDVWRVITRIMSAHAFDLAQGPEHAMECGAALGHFHYLISDMDPDSIGDPLPGFHITSGYLAAYDKTLEKPEARELLKASVEARRLAKFIEERRSLALCLEKAEAAGELKKRMFHGDPKVNNIMIDDVTVDAGTGEVRVAAGALERLGREVVGHAPRVEVVAKRAVDGVGTSGEGGVERFRLPGGGKELGDDAPIFHRTAS